MCPDGRTGICTAYPTYATAYTSYATAYAAARTGILTAKLCISVLIRDYPIYSTYEGSIKALFSLFRLF
jgi:hypothetical protein